MTSAIHDYVERVRALAAEPARGRAVRDYLRETVCSLAAGTTSFPAPADDDNLLHEDETVSVWQVRFRPDVLVPPHDHCMPTFIGVYEGAEENFLYRRDDDGLKLVKSRVVRAGEVLSLGGDGIHAVRCHDGRDCLALHVYLGALTRVPRNLYEWRSGRRLPFTDEAYDRLKRPYDGLPQ